MTKIIVCALFSASLNWFIIGTKNKKSRYKTDFQKPLLYKKINHQKIG